MPHRSKPKAGKEKMVYVAEAGLAGGAGARLRRGIGLGGRGRGRRTGGKLQPKHLGARGGEVVGGGRLVYQKTRGPIAYFGDAGHGKRKQLVVDEERGVHLHRIKRVGQSTRYMHYRHGTRGFGAAKEAVLAAKAAARVAQNVADAAAAAIKHE